LMVAARRGHPEVRVS